MSAASGGCASRKVSRPAGSDIARLSEPSCQLRCPTGELATAQSLAKTSSSLQMVGKAAELRRPSPVLPSTVKQTAPGLGLDMRTWRFKLMTANWVAILARLCGGAQKQWLGGHRIDFRSLACAKFWSETSVNPNPDVPMNAASMKLLSLPKEVKSHMGLEAWAGQVGSEQGRPPRARDVGSRVAHGESQGGLAGENFFACALTKTRVTLQPSSRVGPTPTPTCPAGQGGRECRCGLR